MPTSNVVAKFYLDNTLVSTQTIWSGGDYSGPQCGVSIAQSDRTFTLTPSSSNTWSWDNNSITYTYEKDIESYTTSTNPFYIAEATDYEFSIYAISKTRTTAKGTWLLNEELTDSYYLAGQRTYYVDGYCEVGIYNGSYPFIIEAITFASTEPNGYIYFGSNSGSLGNGYGDRRVEFYTPNWSGTNIEVAAQEEMEGDSEYYTISKTSEDGIKLRTFTITGGTDVENEELINLLESTCTFLAGDEEVTYNITTDLLNCTAASDNPTTIKTGAIAKLTFTPNTGYYFKEFSVESLTYATLDDVTVLSNGNLQVNIVNPTGDVTIGISAYIITYDITYNLTNCTGTNLPSTANYNETFTLTFTANEGYTLPDEIKVTNGILDYWSSSTGELQISQPDEGITITIKAFKEGNSKPVYKYINGSWVKQTAYEYTNGSWNKISTAKN